MANNRRKTTMRTTTEQWQNRWIVSRANQHGDLYIGKPGETYSALVIHNPTNGDTQETADFLVRAHNNYSDLLEVK